MSPSRALFLVLVGCSGKPSDTSAPPDETDTDADSDTDSDTDTDTDSDTDTDPYPGLTDPWHLFPDGTPTLSASTIGAFCPVDTGTGDTGIEAATLSATVDGTDVTIAFHGEMGGCNLPAPAVVGLDAATGIATLRWASGDCDLVFCAEFEATFVGFPSGSWQLQEGRTGTTADIVVP